MTPGQIQAWLEQHSHRMDNSSQYLGTEPNNWHKPWDSVQLRYLLAASWPYFHSAGNQSLPAVGQSINDHPQCYADRWYLPETPRDWRLLKNGGVPVFGVESKHQARDFDVVATSISYMVLLINFCKYLELSGIPLRWAEREAKGLENWPMVMVGGQAYCAPGAMETVVDAVWLGEVENEPGNYGGIGDVSDYIIRLKADGLWATDRLECYRRLAREFNHLYFPRFTDVLYTTGDRGLEHPSKQVSGYRSNLPGLAASFQARHVIDLDKTAPLRSMPLLYTSPSMGAGDLEVARGNIAASEYVLIHGQGLRQLGSWQGDDLHPHGADLGVLKCDSAGRRADVSHVLMNGEREMVTVSTVGGHQVICTPDHELSVVRGPAYDARKHVPGEFGPRAFPFSHGRQGAPSRLEVLASRPREFARADELVPGADYVPVYYGQNVWAAQEQVLETAGFSRRETAEVELPAVLDEDVAWLLGMLAGDVTVKSGHAPCIRIQTEDPGVAARTSQVLLRLFGRDVEPWSREGAREGRLTFELRSRPVLRWLEANFGITGNRDRRRVPELVLRSPRHVVAAYISGFYDSDGTYDDRNGRPSWVSGSEELIRVLSLLLLNLGTPCSVIRVPYAGQEDSRGITRQQDCWKVQGLQAEDGDWAWLRPAHTRRLVQVLRWQEEFCHVRGRVAAGGVIYAPVREVTGAGSALSYDLAVPEFTSFTCNGMLVHNCPAWCTFCRLSWVTKPYRQVGVARSIEQAKVWKKNMGSLEMSPFGPDFPMHTRKKELLSRLLAEVGDEIDSTAIRIDDFTSDGNYVQLQAAGQAFTVTLGLEAVSQRMRDLVGKGTSDAEVCDALYKGIRAGFRKFKFFLIFGYPGEDDADLQAIARLGRRLAEIRDELNQPNVVIQFSWTPLLIEAQTPFQWFAPTPPDHRLIPIIDELRDLKIETKIGTKAQPDKVALFQACQRASRDSGAAIVDVIEAMPLPCWGGVPKGTREALEAALRAHGFANGLADLFDERGEYSMFGWEFIGTGASQQLMWRTHRQMVEFLQGTDGASYDALVADPRYRGQEFVGRCDTTCEGAACGACKPADYAKRRQYMGLARAGDAQVDLSQLVRLDESTVAAKVVCRIRRPERYRQVGNDHWRFSVRRAAYQAQEGMPFRTAKRSIRFASDGIKVKDGSAGTDYVEFGITEWPDLSGPAEETEFWQFTERFKEVLAPWLEVQEVTIGPRQASMPTSGTAFYELELDDLLAMAVSRLDLFRDAAEVPLRLASSSAYFGTGSDTVNARDLIKDAWLLRTGHKLYLRMLATGPAGPYQLAASLLGRTSWLDLAHHPAKRLDWFADLPGEVSLWLPECASCGSSTMANLLDEPYPGTLCPRCDDGTRSYVAGLYPRGELAR